MNSSTSVRVRFAPSPTGSLHVGGGRTALFNYLFAYGQARREGRDGTFILRIEDTDQTRLVEGAIAEIQEVLHWFGLDWDEGPDKGGPHGPYIQSERIGMYQAAAQQLIDEGKAYRCFCTRERLQMVREDQQKRGLPPGYDRYCRNLPQAEVQHALDQGMPFTIRFAMPREGETVVNDMIRGEMVFQNALMEDLILLKSDGFPTYHLGNVVDDHDMEITHIMRGDEWIATAPIHVQLYKAFGWDAPAVRAHATDPRTGRRQALEAARLDGDGGVPQSGLPARGADELPGAARLEPRRDDRDLLEGRPAPALHARAGQPIARPRSTTPSCSGSTSTTLITS